MPLTAEDEDVRLNHHIALTSAIIHLLNLLSIYSDMHMHALKPKTLNHLMTASESVLCAYGGPGCVVAGSYISTAQNGSSVPMKTLTNTSQPW